MTDADCFRLSTMRRRFNRCEISWPKAPSRFPKPCRPMAAGIFGFMGYDTVRLIEKLPEMTPDTIGVPDAILIRPTLMLIFDNVKDEMILVTPVRP